MKLAQAQLEKSVHLSSLGTTLLYGSHQFSINLTDLIQEVNRKLLTVGDRHLSFQAETDGISQMVCHWKVRGWM